MATAGKWKQEWDSKKKYFEKESGKKKPSEKYLGFFPKGSGLTKAFEEMDAEYLKLSKMGPSILRGSAFDEFEKAIKTAERAGNAYTAVLEKAIAKESNKKQLLPLLRILIDDIGVCIASAKAELQDAIYQRNKTVIKEPGREEDYAKEGLVKARALSAVKEGLMWIAMQQRKPDVNEFNKGAKMVAGNIYQLVRVLGDIYGKNSPEYVAIKEPLKMLKGRSKAGVPDNTETKALLAELGKFKKDITSLAPILKKQKREKW